MNICVVITDTVLAHNQLYFNRFPSNLCICSLNSKMMLLLGFIATLLDGSGGAVALAVGTSSG